jgi:hypothetical protein
MCYERKEEFQKQNNEKNDWNSYTVTVEEEV